MPGLANHITRPGSASENTIYADLAFAASSPGLGKMAFLDRIRLEGRQSKIIPLASIVGSEIEQDLSFLQLLA
jgi:hypothetical protein